jgi:hypothetical protein
MSSANRILVLVSIVAAAACHESPLSPSATAAKQLAVSSDATVTSLLADADASIAPTLQIQSDGLGAYRPSSTVTSSIQSIGAYVLDVTSSRGNRTVKLNFTQPIAGSGPNGGAPVAIPSGAYKVHMIAKCNLYNLNMLNMAPGTTINCPLHVGSISYGGATYALQMNPLASAADVAYPETNYANVTCTSAASPCNAWRITPNGAVTNADGSVTYQNVAKLLKQVTSKGSTTSVNQGDFLVSFAFTVTNP